MGFIYVIRNTCNDKVYVGQTVRDVTKRFEQHKRDARNKKIPSSKLHSAMRKYGADRFYIEILEKNVPDELLDELEISYIALFDSCNHGYNITAGGHGRSAPHIVYRDRVLEYAQNGYSNKEIAKMLNLKHSTVHYILYEMGYRQRISPLSYDADILRLTQQGYSVTSIAKQLHIGECTVRKARCRTDCEQPNPLLLENRINVADLIADYQSDMPIKQLYDKYQTSHVGVKNLLNKYNIPLRQELTKTHEVDVDMVVTDYYLHMPFADIMKKYNLTQSQMYHILESKQVWRRPQFKPNGNVQYYHKQMISKANKPKKLPTIMKVSTLSSKDSHSIQGDHKTNE